MEDQDIVAYNSTFVPNISINVVFKENTVAAHDFSGHGDDLSA